MTDANVNQKTRIANNDPGFSQLFGSFYNPFMYWVTFGFRPPLMPETIPFAGFLREFFH